MPEVKEPFLAHLMRKGEVDAFASKTIPAPDLDEATPIALAWAEKVFEDEGGVHFPTTLYLKRGAKNQSIKEWAA
jgi:hypothetical protein